jgi:hypothetical protein
MDPAVDSNRVNQAALRMATEPGTGDLSRITAMQVCAQRHLAEALPLAVQLAQQGGSVSIRVVAIAALGELGGEPEQTLLQELGKQNEPALRAAVSRAARRLNDRMAQAKSGARQTKITS